MALYALGQHLAANALHGHEGIADDLAIACHSIGFTVVVGVAEFFGAWVAGSQVPGQPPERFVRSDGHDVTLANRSLDHQLLVGVFRQGEHGSALDAGVVALEGKQHVD